ncbi:hypothetical protein SAMN05216257_102287 [Meinhardsimonia xiamenensis]|jgi:hypothetical protein|uniref:Uncharacterized protein n=1 Tax=Meinhardsimonia xiamenensis TaxID=990712 RepID=A0A1G9AUY2_9RHOB|nr:hypothetical protein [Meinhardsimonia xiamenensis]PRX35237.1 hypothetical protein LV81_01832 [Meinhardsimonia xiamenensis]SDK31087.1 hypothetical protein SAMN05216257_102287 [Meinhardsimonia xiamenensis]
MWKALAALLALLPGAGLALEPLRYLDDRSTPEAVIQSLYNAVSMHHYPRAWSYFDDDVRPDFHRFVAGYADTLWVDVRTGEVVSEGAAGTTYWLVPTVIAAVRRDGSRAVFAGCYVLRQTNPDLIKEPPYDPIAIFKGRLRPVAVPFAEAKGDCSGF